MPRIHRAVLLAGLVLLAPALSGCESFDIDKFDVFGLNEKKKLPGDRKPVFPEGVPGVTQGIPPEYVKGSQPPPETAQAPAAGPQAPAAEPAKKTATVAPIDESKPKVRKPKVAKQKLIPNQDQQPAQGQQQGQQPAAAPWPAQNQQQPPQQQSGTAPWPSAPAPGTFSR